MSKSCREQYLDNQARLKNIVISDTATNVAIIIDIKKITCFKNLALQRKKVFFCVGNISNISGNVRNNCPYLGDHRFLLVPV